MPTLYLEFQHHVLTEDAAMDHLFKIPENLNAKKLAAAKNPKFSLEELPCESKPKSVTLSVESESFDWIPNHFHLYPRINKKDALQEALRKLTEHLFASDTTIRRREKEDVLDLSKLKVTWVRYNLSNDDLSIQKASILQLIRSSSDGITKTELEKRVNWSQDLHDHIISEPKIRFDESTGLFSFEHTYAGVVDLESMLKLLQMSPFGKPKDELAETYLNAPADIDKLLETKRAIFIMNSDRKIHQIYPVDYTPIVKSMDADLQQSWSEAKLPTDGLLVYCYMLIYLEVELDNKLLQFGAISEQELEQGHSQRAKSKFASTLLKRKNQTTSGNNSKNQKK